jgi:hypothetical protein
MFSYVAVDSMIVHLDQWFPKCGARPPGGAQEVCREKNWMEFAFSNFQLTLFARNVSPGSYYEFHHTMNLFKIVQNLIQLRVFVDTVWSQNFDANFFLLVDHSKQSSGSTKSNVPLVLSLLGWGGWGIN